jgi:hypothetical protein
MMMCHLTDEIIKIIFFYFLIIFSLLMILLVITDLNFFIGYYIGNFR